MRYERADLIVVGGGLLAILASTLAARRGLTTVLIDPARPDDYPLEPWPAALNLADPHSCLTRLQQRSLELWQELEQELDVKFLSRRWSLSLAPPETPVLEQLQENLTRVRQAYEVWAPETVHNRLSWLSRRREVLAVAVPSAAELSLAGLVEPLWNRARRQGVRTFAETPLDFLDLEYDQPTAVGPDCAYRGTHLLVAAETRTPTLLGGLTGVTVGTSLLSALETSCPETVTVHFQKAPVRLHGGTQGSWLYRRHPDEPAENTFHRQFQDQWMPRQRFRDQERTAKAEWSRDGLPLLGRHPLRPDLFVASGLGDLAQPIAPAAAEVVVSCILEHTLPDGSSLRVDRKELQDPVGPDA